MNLLIKTINFFLESNPQLKNKNNERLTMSIIHCGFVPRQNNNINQRLIYQRNNPADDSTTKS